MTAAHNHRHQIETLPAAAHGPSIAARLVAQWPKAVILFGIVLTFAWATVLAWVALFVLDLI